MGWDGTGWGSRLDSGRAEPATRLEHTRREGREKESARMRAEETRREERKQHDATLLYITLHDMAWRADSEKLKTWDGMEWNEMGWVVM